MEENNEKIVQNKVKEEFDSNQKRNNNGKKIVLLIIALILVFAIGICVGIFFSTNDNKTINNSTITNTKDNTKTDDVAKVIQVTADIFDESQDYIKIYGKDSNGNVIWEYKTTEEKTEQIINEGLHVLTTRNDKVYVNEWGKLYILDMQTGNELYHASDSDLPGYSPNMGKNPKFIFDEDDNIYTFGYLTLLQKYDKNAKLKGALDIGLYHTNDITMKIEGDNLVITTIDNETIVVDLNQFTIINDTTSTPVQNQTNTNNEYDKDAYVKKINEIKNEFNDVDLKYGLVYIDEDDVPELIVDCEWYWQSIYKLKNSEVVSIAENDAYGTHGSSGYSYIPKKNIFIRYATDYDGYGYEIYDENMEMQYSVYCSFDGHYKKNGDTEITQEDFEKLSYRNQNPIDLKDEAKMNEKEIIDMLTK